MSHSYDRRLSWDDVVDCGRAHWPLVESHRDLNRRRELVLLCIPPALVAQRDSAGCESVQTLMVTPDRPLVVEVLGPRRMRFSSAGPLSSVERRSPDVNQDVNDGVLVIKGRGISRGQVVERAH